jgi:hypothetical protein
LLVAAGGRPASAAEDCFGGILEFDAGGLGAGQELAGEMEQVLRVCLLYCMEAYDVGPEAFDGRPMVSVLGFETVDVGCLGTELAKNGVQRLVASETWGCRGIRGIWGRVLGRDLAGEGLASLRCVAPPATITLSIGAAGGAEPLRRARRYETTSTFLASFPAHHRSSAGMQSAT